MTTELPIQFTSPPAANITKINDEIVMVSNQENVSTITDNNIQPIVPQPIQPVYSNEPTYNPNSFMNRIYLSLSLLICSIIFYPFLLQFLKSKFSLPYSKVNAIVGTIVIVIILIPTIQFFYSADPGNGVFAPSVLSSCSTLTTIIILYSIVLNQTDTIENLTSTTMSS